MGRKYPSWGEKIWEDKIKTQGEIGVVSGVNGSLSNLRKRTSSTLRFMEENVFSKIAPNSKILDLGVGPMARLAIPIAKKGFKVTGVDISNTTLDLALKHSEKDGAKIKLLKEDVISLNSLKGNFDFIYCIEIFEHIPKHLSLVSLIRIKNLLGKDGFFLLEFSVECGKTLKSELFKLFYFLGHRIKSLFKKTFPVTCYSYTIDEINDLTRRVGLKIIERQKGLFLFKKI